MEWERPVGKFLKVWKRRIVGALVSGSRISGGANRNSDVDVQLILKPGTKWRERGNKIVEGILIEYFANPPEQIRKYFRKEWEIGKPFTARMFATGKIILDGDGTARQLVREAKRWLRRRPKFTKYDRELLKYSAWDMADDVDSVPKEWLPYVNYQFLGDLFSRYSRAIGWEETMPSKTWKFLEKREKYHVKEYPDRKFLRLFLKAIKRPDRAMLKRIVRHIHESLGGFDIDGWRLRTGIEE